MWKPFISESVFCIKSSAEILGIIGGLKKALHDCPHARGDPQRFCDHLSVYSCGNEDKYGRDANWRECAEYLSLFPEGCVSVFGPADSVTWWPKRGAENAANMKWDSLVTGYFNLLANECPHPWIRGTAPMRQIALRQGVTKKGEAWIDKLFADTRESTFRMTEMLTNLVICQ